jgi:glutathione S-transferase
VPVLVDGDFSMYESGAIVEYLDERFADGPKLFPGGVRERAVVRRLVLECDNYVRLANDKLTRQLFFRPEAEWDQGDIATGRQGWLNEIEWLEKTLKSDFLAGEISAADFTLYPYFGTLRRLETKTNLGLLDACGPRLLAWAKRIESLPYFGKTYPPHWKQ